MNTALTQNDPALRSFTAQEARQILQTWTDEMLRHPLVRADIYGRERITGQCSEFLEQFLAAYRDHADAAEGPGWEPVRSLVVELSRSRVKMGFSPAETALFLFSLRRPMFEAFRSRLEGVGTGTFTEINRFNEIIEHLALLTLESYSRTREELIKSQAESILELSNPVIKIWDRILLCVVIGTVDTVRSQQLLEAVLNGVKELEARIAILDITGVTVLDTQVLQHLFNIIRGVRLMGAEVVVTGVNPAVAASVAKLEMDLSTFNPRSTLRLGLQYAFERLAVRL